MRGGGCGRDFGMRYQGLGRGEKRLRLREGERHRVRCTFSMQRGVRTQALSERVGRQILMREAISKSSPVHMQPPLTVYREEANDLWHSVRCQADTMYRHLVTESRSRQIVATASQPKERLLEMQASTTIHNANASEGSSLWLMVRPRII